MIKASDAPRRILLGSGRSATTWVLDCLAQANCLRPIFEPLHPLESSIGKDYANRVMIQGDRDDLLKDYFLMLAAGDIHSRWIDYRAPNNLLFPPIQRFMSLAFAKRWVRVWRSYMRDMIAFSESIRREHTLVKCIRANLMAGWLCQDLGFKVAVVIRHPCAVIESQYRARKSWNPLPLLDQYRFDNRLHAFTDGRYREILDRDLSLLEAMTLNWVIENQQVVENAPHESYYVVASEQLVTNPEASWPGLCRALELNSVPDRDLLITPSQQASDKTTKNSSDRRWKKPKWRSELTDNQLDSIRRILKATDCNIYSIEEDLPNLPGE